MAGGRHVRIDSSMGTVCSAPLLLSLVDLDVRYNKGVNIQTLHFSIALSILEQIQNELSRFHRPASLSIGLPVLGLSSTPYTTTETSEGNGLLVNQNILQISLCLD